MSYSQSLMLNSYPRELTLSLILYNTAIPQAISIRNFTAISKEMTEQQKSFAWH